MGITNSSFWLKEYVDDFGNKYPNYKFKLSATAPKFNTIKGIADYQERQDGIACADTKLFKHRRLRVKFNSGNTIEFPVPKPDLIDDMIKALKPSLLDNAIPGTGDDEAACIDLIGERWTYVPPGLLGFNQSEFRKTPIQGVADTGSKKVTYIYDYNSEIPTVGEINTQFAIHIDSQTIRDCQVEGMTAFKQKGDEIIACSARTLGIVPRGFIIKTVLQYDSNGIIPGGKDQFRAIRKAPVSGDSGLLFSDKAKAVGKEIAKCAYCLGWEGESAKNVHLLIAASNIIG